MTPSVPASSSSPPLSVDGANYTISPTQPLLVRDQRGVPPQQRRNDGRSEETERGSRRFQPCTVGVCSRSLRLTLFVSIVLSPAAICTDSADGSRSCAPSLTCPHALSGQNRRQHGLGVSPLCVWCVSRSMAGEVTLVSMCLPVRLSIFLFYFSRPASLHADSSEFKQKEGGGWGGGRGGEEGKKRKTR